MDNSYLGDTQIRENRIFLINYVQHVIIDGVHVLTLIHGEETKPSRTPAGDNINFCHKFLLHIPTVTQY